MTDITTTSQAPTSEAGAERAADLAAGAKEQAANVASIAKDQATRGVQRRRPGQGRRLRGRRRSQGRLRRRPPAAARPGRRAVRQGRRAGRATSAASSAPWPPPATPGPAKDIVAAVADQADGMSQRLSDGGLDRTLEDARRLARNRPGLFLAGAALAGFVAARVARTADTGALKEAASPSQGTNGAHGQATLGSAPTSPSRRPRRSDPRR